MQIMHDYSLKSHTCIFLPDSQNTVCIVCYVLHDNSMDKLPAKQASHRGFDFRKERVEQRMSKTDTETWEQTGWSQRWKDTGVADADGSFLLRQHF